MSLDPGISNERTALAWQRTALSILAAAGIITRLTFDRLGVLALIGLAVAIPLTCWVLNESRLRYAHDAGVRMRTRPRGGKSPAALALATVVVASLELAALLRVG